MQMTVVTRDFELPTVLLLVGTYLLWALGTMIWQDSGFLSVMLIAVAVAQFSSLQHEVLHGHPFRNPLMNEATVFAALALFIPYRRFRDSHLQHHNDPNLTDPYDDPESNYLAPHVWARLPGPVRALLRVNNSLLGRMVLGPAISVSVFVVQEMRHILRGNRVVAQDWALHLIGVGLVLVWLHAVGMPVWAYLVAVYLALAILKVRSFLEHRAHEAFRARTVIIEDRGPLALLFLNNNFHVVHHMHPTAPWYRIPALYRARKDHYLRRNEGYVYRSYAAVFARYLFRAKDPVSHPVWPVRRH
jgi:fatty acid desaturase